MNGAVPAEAAPLAHERARPRFPGPGGHRISPRRSEVPHLDEAVRPHGEVSSGVVARSLRRARDRPGDSCRSDRSDVLKKASPGPGHWNARFHLISSARSAGWRAATKPRNCVHTYQEVRLNPIARPACVGDGARRKLRQVEEFSAAAMSRWCCSPHRSRRHPGISTRLAVNAGQSWTVGRERPPVGCSFGEPQSFRCLSRRLSAFPGSLTGPGMWTRSTRLLRRSRSSGSQRRRLRSSWP